TAALLAATALFVGGSSAVALEIAQVLGTRPSQAEVVFDTPDQTEWPTCKIEELTTPHPGWTVRNPAGLLVRKAVDTNGDGNVDVQTFYHQGKEVFRDLDANFNGRPDEYRWFNVAGSRWGVDANEDGTPDRWKMISAEEASAEVLHAVAAKNFQRFQAVMAADAELDAIGLSAEGADRVRKVREQAGERFQRLAAVMPRGVKWVGFSGQQPVAVSAEEAGASKDVVLYMNATVMCEAGDAKPWLRIGELVRAGDCWKLVDVPSVIDEKTPVEQTTVLIPALADVVAKSSKAGGDSVVEEDVDIAKFVAMLQKHDATLPEGGDARAMVAYHVKRAELCAHVGAR
ncbi:MAG: hypothetical protein ACRDD1_09600, partial [Planctomycetia bacterium]